ncbi:MAG: GIY-YIG nuclease family protein [Flavobacteriales bacterium]|nr:GIY-YIG nuclease family protein [Flavobacteriales bacterium]MBK7940801.1 GIY-YIG nuclease family protein [Flavobacteriales bacterium]MBK9700781.1 GIY-YIG nuclease family protein [Flavobacteriales bacterium]
MGATFYMLYSAQLDRFYIGHTTERMDERLRKHLSAHRGWTSRAKDWRVVHEETYADKATAYQREREVKGWKKRFRIEGLIGAAR